MNQEETKDAKYFPLKVEMFLILLAALLAFGTIGFKLLHESSFKDAFLRTIESLAFLFKETAGFGKALEIFLSIFGVFLIWWVLWSLFDLIFEGNLREYLKISNFLSKLSKMKNHYIIAGGGRVGEVVAAQLAKTKKDYIVIEKDEPTLNKLKKKDFFVMHGDVSDELVLKQANIKSAKALIIAMPETEKNLLITMIAKELNPRIKVYARADKPAFVTKLKKAGAEVVIVPEQVAAEKFIESLK